MTPRAKALTVAVFAATAWFGAFLLPWLDVEGSSRSLTREDLLASAVPYERALAALPLATLPIACGTLVAAAVWDRRTGARWGTYGGAVVLASGALALVSSCRMLGFVAVRAFDRGDAQVLPGPAPLAVAVAGLACATWGWLALWRAGVRLPMCAVAAFGTLAMMPFAPFGASGSGAFLYDELSIAATTASGPGVLREAGEALAWMRAALWLAAAGGLVWAVGIVSLPRLNQSRWRVALLAPGPIAAVGLCALFLARWAAVDGLGLSWNPIAPIGVLASAGLAAWPLLSAARRREAATSRSAP